MDTAPAAPSDAQERVPTGGRSTIGFPSIPSRREDDPEPVPVPSIDSPTESALAEPALTESAPTDPTSALSAADVPARPVPAAPDGSAGPGRPGAGPGHLTALPPLVDGSLLTDDEETFAPSVRAKLKSYVYLLVDPRTGRAFYAGIGRDDRCFEHVRVARGGVVGQPTSAHDALPGVDRIREIEASGRPVRIEILRYGLGPSEARMVEGVAHDLLGLPGAPEEGGQRRPAGEVRLLLTKRAKFKRPHQVVLLRVGPPGTDTSYEQVRHGWRIGRRWTDANALRSPHWAVIVVGELVDSVYRLDGWLGGTADGGADRYSFVGTRDIELERRYVGRSAAPYLGKGSQSSVSYVWCGPHWVNGAE